MAQIDATYDALDAQVKPICAPLFATGQYGVGGHTETSINATATFVKYRERIYAVTCHHVLAAFLAAAVKQKLPFVPSLHNGRAILHLGTYGPNGSFAWSFRSCRSFPTAEEIVHDDQAATLARDRSNADLPDIAIAEITSVWPSLIQQRNARALDLDTWEQPDWSETQSVWVAFGYPDGHKYEQDGKLAVPMPKVRAEQQTSRLDQRESFVLCSPLGEDHGWGFSGMSGGPIFAPHKTKDCFYFAGITYEGSPGLRDAEGDDEAFLTKADILLRGYLISPAAFERWLELAQYGVATS
ncbi:trypsin-like peptidase domain-containing protein [Cognatilysobacter segetis]|uniref:trypsin-like peptidase domain-containing protein n=1 Tax=Cognatilysobacter segetis TaxID=2492394 RepID=UPI0010611C2A|nr:trypsin-like peptidase domain-containing protein [Lysobacter segetis]